MNITQEFKQKVVTALLEVRGNYGGADAAFAKQWKINSSVFSRLKKGETEGLLKDIQWLNLGRELNVSADDRTPWKIARTSVFEAIESDVIFCQQHSKAMTFVDECEIGKTTTAKYLSKSLKNCFYVDCSQSKTKQLFIRSLAAAIGIENTGTYASVKANIKYYLRMLERPIVILDEAGDLDYPAFLEIKEFWNATDGVCGWYMIGADGLQEKWERGIRSKKVGFREMFSRFNSRFMSIVPVERTEKQQFYKKLISDVLAVNMTDKSKMVELVKKCMASDASGQIAGLRRAETLLTLNGVRQ